VTVALLDVNVLVALGWPNHVHHEAAHAWFAENQGQGWATCPLTEGGFIRVSSNPKVTPEARRPGEALELLRRIAELPHHVFWDDSTSFTSSPHVDAERWIGYRQVTDAHLLAVALAHGGSVATFDRGLSAVVPAAADRELAVVLIPALR
jgi:hypothetical protein